MGKQETKAELETRLKAAAADEIMRVVTGANGAVRDAKREQAHAEGRARAWQAAFLALLERMGDR